MYYINNNKIIINDKENFNIKHILECGQIFRFFKEENRYVVISGQHLAYIYENEQNYEIATKDVYFFERFFDLKTDYASIKRQLKNFNNDFLLEAIDYGYGIRILQNNPIEMIVSFIISANNNIPRIKKSLNEICCAYGEKVDNYYLFPTLEKLQTADEEFFKNCGLGYRSKYLVETIGKLNKIDFGHLANLSTDDLRSELMTLKGVGRKVADCIMLFGFNRHNVFPIDTWTNKVYEQHFNEGEKTRLQIANYFVDLFKGLSGYAQQYVYYKKQNFKN